MQSIRNHITIKIVSFQNLPQKGEGDQIFPLEREGLVKWVGLF